MRERRGAHRQNKAHLPGGSIRDAARGIIVIQLVTVFALLASMVVNLLHDHEASVEHSNDVKVMLRDAAEFYAYSGDSEAMRASVQAVGRIGAVLSARYLPFGEASASDEFRAPFDRTAFVPQTIDVVTHDVDDEEWGGYGILLSLTNMQRSIQFEYPVSVAGEQVGILSVKLSNLSYARAIVMTVATHLFCIFVLLLVVYQIRNFYIPSLINPIQELFGIARRISTGDYAAPGSLSNGFKEFHDLHAVLSDMSAEIRNSDARLRKQIEAKTRELALKTAQAERAAKDKSEYLTTMSHELKTPVHSIILMAELILMESDSLRVPEALERQREAANHIHGAAGALLNLVDGIVSAAQLEHPETREMRIATFDLRPIVAEAIERVAHMAYHRRLRLYHVIQADVPVHLRGDSRGLRIILNNLLDNAIKFTEQGSVALEVRLDEDSDDQGALCFDVRDTGIGIPPEEHVRIFEAFTQINTGGKRTHAGTGVGLGAVKRESESMGGCVTLHSAPGQGACFTLHAAFDVVEERDMTDEHIAPPEIRLALLLCGDDPDARRAIETSLALVAIEPVRVLDLDCFKAQGMAALSGADAVLVEQASLRADDLNALRHADTGRRWLSLEFMDAPNDLASVRDRTGIEPYPFSVILSVERLRKALGIDASSQKMNRHSASREVDGMRVLVVDDSPAAPVVLARFLSKWGVNLFTAESGFEAIRFLQKNEPVDLILMDIQMPEIDGFATLAELRARGLLGPAKIYASTAGNLPDVQRRIEASAFDGALNKPFSANGLLDVLVSVARTAPPAAEAINDAAVRAEIRQAFILEIPDQRALGERLRSCDNAEALAAWVHKVAGMAAMSGIEPMAAELYDLEQRLKSEKVAQGECNIIWEVVMKWLDDVEKEAGAGSAV